MSKPRWLRAVVRRARRVPGYRRLRRAVLVRLRRSETARDIIARVFTGSTAGRRSVPHRFPSAGELLSGVGVDTLPVVLISLVSVPHARIEAAVCEVGRYQLLYANFRPVFLLDHPAFAATRQFGFPTELLIHAEEWDFPDTTWAEYAAARLGDIRRRYRAATVVQVPQEGVNDGVRITLASQRVR